MKKIKCVVEIPRYSNTKYEINKVTNKLVVDRFVDFPYPSNYGFVENTHWDDGDALDVFILGETIIPLVEVSCYPLAVIEMIDNGESDSKLICSLDKKIDYYEVERILYFLNNYKKGIKIKSISIRNKDIEDTLKKAYNTWVTKKIHS